MLPPGDGEVCRTGENPYSAQGALKVLYGNLAPDGSVVKEGGGGSVHVMPHRAGPRVRFGRDGLRGHQRGAIVPGDVVVIRYEGRPEARACADARAHLSHLRHGAFHLGGPDHRQALLRATKGPTVGHVSPEAAAGSPIALICEAIPSPWTSRAAR